MNDIVQSTEEDLRRRLGVPDGAQQVLILAESSHWDPNWMLTSEGYYDRFVQENLDRAIDELEREPRRVYSIECIFFLRMYWERNPQQRAKVRDLVNAGRLFLTGSGVTTADTLLPSAEVLLRDFLVGQEWLRAHGMHQAPDLAYFTDSFGCSPTLPSLLRAAGFDRTAITRIDGMNFVGADLESSRRFPRPGSSAERLLEQERTQDFVWRDRNGAEVLCHWNAFTYFQGDMLTFHGLSRVYLVRVAFFDGSDRHVARRIGQYVDQLSPYARTPYLFCPIGGDFIEPIPDLVARLDRYNRNHYRQTGVWAVNATLDDYLALVDCHRDQLPVLDLDPNPYWTGFYTARPRLKERCYELVDELLLAERLALLPENECAAEELPAEIEDAWWTAVVSNHHDFITGTSPDEVVEEEQIPELDRALQATRAVVDGLAAGLPTPDADPAPAALPRWTREGDRIVVETPTYALELSEAAGGAITRAWEPETGRPLLTGLSNDLVSYQESGGLWRMGYEFRGGIWREKERAGAQRVDLDVREGEHGLEISRRVTLDGQLIRQTMWLRDDSPLIRCRVEGLPAERRTIVVRLRSTVSTDRLTMDTPGGVVARPPRRIYDPTFWPLRHFVHLHDEEGRGIALLQAHPGAVSYRPDGTIELVALRNAVRERVLGLVPLPANPAAGHEWEDYTFTYAMLFTTEGDRRANGIDRIAHEFLNSTWSRTGRLAVRERAAAAVVVDRPDVFVTAVKPASRGQGLIVRLSANAVPDGPVAVAVPAYEVEAAFLCDARERDLSALQIRDGQVRLSMPGTIATLRLVPA